MKNKDRYKQYERYTQLCFICSSVEILARFDCGKNQKFLPRHLFFLLN